MEKEAKMKERSKKLSPQESKRLWWSLEKVAERLRERGRERTWSASLSTREVEYLLDLMARDSER